MLTFVGGWHPGWSCCVTWTRALLPVQVSHDAPHVRSIDRVYRRLCDVCLWLCCKPVKKSSKTIQKCRIWYSNSWRKVLREANWGYFRLKGKKKKTFRLWYISILKNRIIILYMYMTLLAKFVLIFFLHLSHFPDAFIFCCTKKRKINVSVTLLFCWINNLILWIMCHLRYKWAKCEFVL